MNFYDRLRQEFFRFNDPQFPCELFEEGIPSIKLLTITLEGERFDIVFGDIKLLTITLEGERFEIVFVDKRETWVIVVPRDKDPEMFLHRAGAEDLLHAIFGKERIESMLETVLVALEKVEA